MNDFGLTSIFAWFSPEQRMKAKREKLANLRKEKKELQKLVCNERTAARVEAIDTEIKKIELNLQS